MKMNNLAASLLLVCALTAVNPAWAGSDPAPAQRRTPKEFVQAFYNWYVSSSGNEGDVRGTETVLKQKKQFLDATLYRELSEDEKAAAGSPGEIVGLDFDPFVAANGLIYNKYVTGPAKLDGGKYRVPVYGIESGKRTAKPVLEAEVATRNGQCVFTNFHYGKSEFPQNENLLSVLATLRKDRASRETKK